MIPNCPPIIEGVEQYIKPGYCRAGTSGILFLHAYNSEQSPEKICGILALRQMSPKNFNVGVSR